MITFESLERKVAKWLQSRALERALRRWGGCQVCPWCKQWAQLHDGWHFDSVTDRTIDALHCGNCGGVSRWRFELGMMPLDPIGVTPPPVKCVAPAFEPSWRCFHCDEVFTEERCARLHFGADETYEPVCQIAARDGGLVRALREAEASALEAHQQAHDESGDALNAWRAAVGRYERRIIDAEQAGYDKGVTDMRAEFADAMRIIEPFAKACSISNHEDDDVIDDTLAAGKITFGDMRAARSFFFKTKGAPG